MSSAVCVQPGHEAASRKTETKEISFIKVAFVDILTAAARFRSIPSDEPFPMARTSRNRNHSRVQSRSMTIAKYGEQ